MIIGTDWKVRFTLDMALSGGVTTTLGTQGDTVAELTAEELRAKRFKQFAGACAGLVGILVILLAIEVISVGTIA